MSDFVSKKVEEFYQDTDVEIDAGGEEVEKLRLALKEAIQHGRNEAVDYIEEYVGHLTSLDEKGVKIIGRLVDKHIFKQARNPKE